MKVFQGNGGCHPWGMLLMCTIVLMLYGGCTGIVDPEAEEILRQKLGNTSFTVFPAYIRFGDSDDTYDGSAAESIGAFLEDPEDVRPCFRRLRELRDSIEEAVVPGVAMEELSMGMTNDFEVAIEEGATMVRVGRAIFGERG